MINFTKFLNSSVIVYRGYKTKELEETNKSNIRWYSSNYEIALKYANNNASNVITKKLNYVNYVKFGIDVRKIKFTDIIKLLIEQSKRIVNLSTCEEYQKLSKIHKDKEYDKLYEFWNSQDNKDFVNLVQKFGFDGILISEKINEDENVITVETYGKFIR